MIAAALRGALSDRARDGRVHVVSDLVSGDVPSTKSALTALAKVAPSANLDKVLVVLHRDEDLAWLSLRNAAAVHAIAVGQLNAYDVLSARCRGLHLRGPAGVRERAGQGQVRSRQWPGGPSRWLRC